MNQFDIGYLPKLLIDQILWYFIQAKHCYSAMSGRYKGLSASGTNWPIHILSVVGDMSAVLYNLLHMFFHISSHSRVFGLPRENTQP